MAKIYRENIEKSDSQNMFEILKNFPMQVKEAIEIGKDAAGFNSKPVSNEYLILGMGGSAIGGDLLASFCSATPWANHLLIRTNRGYSVPASINENTNVIASSYSGNTEETISAFEDARKYTDRIICITTGGKLEELALKYGYPVIKVPGGLQPRCALGYSFVPMLYLLQKSSAFKTDSNIQFCMNELLDLLFIKADAYTDLENGRNVAFQLAEKLYNSVPVIYSPAERLDSVNLRWRCQIQENAKQLAFGNLLPEMNHNEINSWSYPEDLTTRFSVIFMRDPYDHPRVKIRFNALHSLIESSVKHVIEIKGDGENLLTRMFDLIYLGDWVSYFMAILNGVDPTPIPLISKLKNQLTQE